MGNINALPAISVGQVPPGAQPTIQVRTCPSGFSTSPSGYCYIQCASGYRPVGESTCQSNTDASVRYIRSGANPGNMGQEQSAREVNMARVQEANTRLENLRVQREMQAARNAEKQANLSTVASATQAKGLVESQQTQFNRSARLVQETNNRLRVKRPPVQPDSEIAKEQRNIQNIVQKNALFIQVVMVLVVMCAVAYMLLPLNTANYTALLILSVAVLYRIFFVE